MRLGHRVQAGGRADDNNTSRNKTSFASVCILGEVQSVPVGILGITSVNIADINPATLTLGDGVGADVPVLQTGAHIHYKKHQGIQTAFFSLAALVATGDLNPSTKSLTLRGKLKNGKAFAGSDFIVVVPEP